MESYWVPKIGILLSFIVYYLRKIDYLQFIQTSKDENYDYIIMTNRHNGKVNDEVKDVKTCLFI